MRGSDKTSGALFSYVDVEARIPARHPLRTIREIVNAVLASLDPEFAELYEGTGRESIPPKCQNTVPPEPQIQQPASAVLHGALVQLLRWPRNGAMPSTWRSKETLILWVASPGTPGG